MTGPIRACSKGRRAIGGGDLDHRIEVRTGDELETLADNFNRMAARLTDSYATLEQKVADRTAELPEALDQLRALSAVSHTVNSSLELQTVLGRDPRPCLPLADAGGGAIYVSDEAADRDRSASRPRMA